MLFLLLVKKFWCLVGVGGGWGVGVVVYVSFFVVFKLGGLIIGGFRFFFYKCVI